MEKQRMEKAESKEKLEDFAYVLDFMPYGHPDDKRPIHKREPLAQVVGEKYFTLLEVSIKKESSRWLWTEFILEREKEMLCSG